MALASLEVDKFWELIYNDDWFSDPQHHSTSISLLLTDNIDKPVSSGSVYLGFDGHLHLF
jgi:hypothetical protein